MTLGVIGKKLGMTQVYDEKGSVIPVTVVEVEPLTVTQVKTVDTDGYSAIQVGTCSCVEKKLSKPQLSHLKKNELPAMSYLKEFRVEDASSYKVGDKVDLTVLDGVAKVDVTGK